MNSWSDSSISFLNTFFQWATPVCTAGAVLFAICLIFVRAEISRRQNLLISQLRLDTEDARRDAAVAQAQAAQANEGAAMANAQAAQANESAAKANEKAEAEKLERVKLEADIAPRGVGATGKTLRELGLFAGTEVTIAHPFNDVETARLALELANVLGPAKWKVSIVQVRDDCWWDLHVYTKELPDDPPQEKRDDAARFLTYILEDNKLTATCFPGMSPKSSLLCAPFSSNGILVTIGPKTTPYFSAKRLEEMLRDLEPDIANQMKEADRRREQLRDIATEKEAIINKYKPRTSTE